jgi:hypothetical protein
LHGDIPLEIDAIRDLFPGYQLRVLESHGDKQHGQLVHEISVLHRFGEVLRLVGNEQGLVELAIVFGPEPRDARGAGVGTRYEQLRAFYPDLHCERNRTDAQSEYGKLDLVTCHTNALAGVEFNFDLQGEQFSGHRLPDDPSLADLPVKNVTVALGGED